MKFRPHHFLCALGFEGKGYSPTFVENFSKIVQKLRGTNGSSTQIEVVSGVDDICHPCPHRRNEKCESQEKIELLDSGHQQVLKLTPGECLTWEEAQIRIVKYMTVVEHQRVCDPCEWRRLGVCEKALIKLREEKDSS